MTQEKRADKKKGGGGGIQKWDSSGKIEQERETDATFTNWRMIAMNNALVFDLPAHADWETTKSSLRRWPEGVGVATGGDVQSHVDWLLHRCTPVTFNVDHQTMALVLWSIT